MKHSRYTLFISDLHLSKDTPSATRLFSYFLKKQAQNSEALYILGDFFDVWVGDDDHAFFNQRIKVMLRRLTRRGVPVYFMSGNRDFLIGQRFAKETGVILLREPTLIHLYGKRILLLHGDGLCTLDRRHQKSRKRMHNRFYQALVLCLPLILRRYFGRCLRSASVKRKLSLSNQIMDVNQEAVIAAMSKASADILVHGHTHRPAIHSLCINGHSAYRVVLGDWSEQAKYLRLDEASELALLKITECKQDSKLN